MGPDVLFKQRLGVLDKSRAFYDWWDRYGGLDWLHKRHTAETFNGENPEC